MTNLQEIEARDKAATPEPANRQVSCMARLASGPEPQDCDWPFCGCDPHASRVLDALTESGWFIEATKDIPLLLSELRKFIAAADEMIAHEQSGGDGWWRGFEALKAARQALSPSMGSEGG